MSLKSKLWFMYLLTITFLGMVTMLLLGQHRDILLKDRKLETQYLVDAAVSTLSMYQTEVQHGSLTLAQAQQQAAHVIGAMRYDGNNYLWINDAHYRMVMHPIKPELNGQSCSHLVFCQKEVKVLGQPEQAGFIEYTWPKPGMDEPQPKISYVKLFKPWGWIVGTGTYVDDVNHLYTQYVLTYGTGVLFFAGLIGFLKFLIIRNATGRLELFGSIIQRIGAERDLSVRVPERGHDEINVMGIQLNVMLSHLNAAFVVVVQRAQELSLAAQQLIVATKSILNSTHEQQDAAAAMAAAVEEVTVSIGHIAEHAESAQTMAQQSGKQATEGGGVIQDVVGDVRQIAVVIDSLSSVLEELGQASGKVSSVIHVIGDVADQTNLLALNAAIEAARAGDQGRGFAVVAEEVRHLAQRTSQSTQEIAQIVQSIQGGASKSSISMHDVNTHVSQGVLRANQAGSAIEQITHGAQTVVAAVEEISLALKEQTMASQDMAKNVELIARMTEMNFAAVEQVSTTAQRLGELADELTAMARQFQLSSTGS